MGQINGGELEPVVLYRVVSPEEAAQLLAERRFKTTENSLSGKFFAETAADAAKWGNLLYGAKQYQIVQVELPKSAAANLIRWERLDSIGPARYGELNEINAPELKVIGIVE